MTVCWSEGTVTKAAKSFPGRARRATYGLATDHDGRRLTGSARLAGHSTLCTRLPREAGSDGGPGALLGDPLRRGAAVGLTLLTGGVRCGRIGRRAGTR